MHSRVQSLRAERPAPADDRSVAQVLADVIRNLQDILSAEIRLAQARARMELRGYRPAAVLILIGVLGGLVSVFFLLLAVAAALALVIPWWAATLIVAVGTAVLSTIMVRAGTLRVRSRAARTAKHLEEEMREGIGIKE
ncbi:MAG TPA: phage holin family protein [Steroidobacteraceae bacterium]